VDWYDDLEPETDGLVVDSEGNLQSYFYYNNYLDILHVNGAGLRMDLRESVMVLAAIGMDIDMYPNEMDAEHVDFYKINDKTDYNLN